MALDEFLFLFLLLCALDHHKKSLDSFDGHGNVDLSNLDLGTDSLRQKMPRPQNDLLQNKRRQKLKRKREDEIERVSKRNKLRLLNKKTLAMCDVSSCKPLRS